MAGDEPLRTLMEALRGDIRVVRSELASARKDISRLERDVDIKHKQNRGSIHEINSFCQKIVDKVNRIEVKYAALSVGSGSLVAVAIKLIEHWWKT